MTDFETWLNDFGYDHILRMLKLRKPGQYTPYEMSKKFIDESLYESDEYTFIQIKEAIELPDKDILLGFREVYNRESIEEEWNKSNIEYRKLSEVHLSYFPEDDDIDNWD